MIKNAFYFILKDLFILKLFKYLSWIFGLVEKKAYMKDNFNFEFYDETAWLTKNYNTHFAQYLMN